MPTPADAPAITAPPAIGLAVRIRREGGWAHGRRAVVEAVVGEFAPEVERSVRPGGREVVRRRPAGQWGYFCRVAFVEAFDAPNPRRPDGATRIEAGASYWGWMGFDLIPEGEEGA